MERTVWDGNREIKYRLTRKRVKNINLRIRRDGAVAVSAHPGVAIKTIDDFVCSKAEWILKIMQRRQGQSYLDELPQEYLDGQRFPLLGELVPLYIRQSERERVEYDGGALTLFVKDPEDGACKRKVFDRWHNGFCAEVFSEVLREVYPGFQTQGVPLPEIHIRSMNSRWGSCMPSKRIVTLNRRLIRTPRCCIEAVVAHELTHFLHPNHSGAFYEALGAVMPDYADRRRVLNQM